MPQKQPIDVFHYLNYRELLGDYYTHRKEERRGFSYRSFSRRAGLKSPNHLKRVIDGERRLTPEMCARYATALGFEGEVASYFHALVSFNQAKSHAEKQRAYEQLTAFRGYRKAHRLDLQQQAYHSFWYIPAIRELRLRTDFEDDPAWIARNLVPSITEKDAQRGVEVLLSLGLFRRAAGGTLEATSEVLSTGAQTASLHISNYHKQMMGRAIEAISTVPKEERDISSLTCCVGPEGLRKIKERIKHFRRELIALATEEEKDGAQVVQIGFQVFPLSTRRETKS